MFLFVLFSIKGYSQNKSNYSLLWRISGKGVTKPSYLFGTMHVKDKRAFEFSDSVMLALQKSEVFALEVHPDTLIQTMFKAYGKGDNGKIRDLLSKEDYNELAKRFQQKNGYMMTEINPFVIDNLIAKDRSKPDDKVTFVDAYLFAIAKTFQKEILGLEKADDQMKLFDEDEDLKEKIEAYLNNEDTEAEEEELDKLTNLYALGNLNAIFDYLNSNDSIDSVLVARNKVMFNSMISRMATQSVFTAVGVAHLPGDEGLIALLKKQGYTVEAVNAQFTGVSERFTVDERKFLWNNFTSKEEGYSVDMPGQPFVQNLKEEGVKTAICSDLTTELYYGCYAMPMAFATKGTNALYTAKKAVERYKSSVKSQITDEKNILINGLPGISFISKDSIKTLRMQFVVKNNMLYCLYMGNKAEMLNGYSANRFFSSLKVFKAADIPTSAWINYKNTKGAFSVALPVEPEVISKEVASPNAGSKPYLLNLYVAADKKNMLNYLIRYNDLPAGLYLKDKEAAFESMYKSLNNMGKIVGKPVLITKDGSEGRSIKLTYGNFSADVNIYIRGNRQYMLLRQDATEGSKIIVNDNFFKSFKFIEYEPEATYIYKPTDESFSIAMYPKAQTVIDTTANTSYIQNASTTMSTNPASGGVYYVEYAKISPYYRADNVDSLYKKVINDLVNYPDSLVKVDTVMFDRIKGREFVSQAKNALSKKRHRLLIDNENLIYLTGYMSNDEFFSEASNKFFSSYVKLKEPKRFDIDALKGQKILNDLQSTDTATFNIAKGALSYYQFKVSELPFMYSALKKTYPDDTLSGGIKHKLIESLETCHDSSSLNELKQLYTAGQSTDKIRLSILNTLPAIDKKQGYPLYLNLLTSQPYIKEEQNYKAFSALQDSIAFTATNLNRLIPLINHKPYRHQLLSLANNMLATENNKPEYEELVKTNYDVFTRYANDDLNTYLADTAGSAYNSGVYYYLQLMSKVASSKQLTDKFTLKIINEGNKESQLLNAVLTRIANNLIVAQPIVNSVLDSIYSRYEVMKAYYKVNQITKVPFKYRAPVEFGRICLYNYVGENAEDENYPDKLTHLGTVIFKGETYYAYSFTVKDYEGGSKEYLGVYKPSKSIATKLDFSDYNSYSLWKLRKKNWQQQAQLLIADWRKQKVNE